MSSVTQMPASPSSLDLAKSLDQIEGSEGTGYLGDAHTKTQIESKTSEKVSSIKEKALKVLEVIGTAIGGIAFFAGVFVGVCAPIAMITVGMVFSMPALVIPGFLITSITLAVWLC